MLQSSGGRGQEKKEETKRKIRKNKVWDCKGGNRGLRGVKGWRVKLGV